MSDEPSLWKIEIFFEPQFDYICQPYWITGNNLGDFENPKVNKYRSKVIWNFKRIRKTHSRSTNTNWVSLGPNSGERCADQTVAVHLCHRSEVHQKTYQAESVAS